MNQVVITTFYHFINFPQVEDLKEPLLTFCKEHELKGTILLAREGINSTISGSREAIDIFYQYLANEMGIKNLVYKESFNEDKPFQKMKVNLKKEIVALGVEDLDVENLKGDYIAAKDWDSFISREDVIIVDTRNKYETLLGSFDKAIDPRTASFRQFPQWFEENLKQMDKDTKIAMFCTGGVRCEKSTAYVKSQGFNNVYHLEGGILKYLEDTQAEKWHGNCFVFDERVALTNHLEAAKDINCICCNKNMNTDDVRKASLLDQMTCLECTGKHAS